jgi:SnoaL-like domain
MKPADPIAITNAYLRIVFTENNHGAGLENLLADDFTFYDPFANASTAREFITNTLRWIDTKKSLHVHRQFVDGNHVCSMYSIEVTTASGAMESFEIVDVVEIRADRIAVEKVYFADPVKFASDMGFASDYLKQFQL